MRSIGLRRRKIAWPFSVCIRARQSAFAGMTGGECSRASESGAHCVSVPSLQSFLRRCLPMDCAAVNVPTGLLADCGARVLICAPAIALPPLRSACEPIVQPTLLPWPEHADRDRQPGERSHGGERLLRLVGKRLPCIDRKRQCAAPYSARDGRNCQALLLTNRGFPGRGND